MKKITILLFGLLLLLTSNLYSVDVIVEGITYPTEMNGSYTEMGTWAGRPYYERTVGMETFSIFYYAIMDPSAGWMIYRGEGQYSGGMWYPWDGHFLLSGNEMLPPATGYDDIPVMSMFSVDGNPTVLSAQAIPVSLWVIVAAFLLAGGFLVYKYYRKPAKAA